MLRSYFSQAFRKLWRNKQFSLINLSGLCIGMAVFFFIAEYIVSEWNTNRFHTNYKNLYRATVQYGEDNSYYLAPGLVPFFKNKVAGIQSMVRLADGVGGGVIEYTSAGSAAVLREEGISYVDSDFLNVFSFPLIDGARSLSRPNQAALSQNMSQKLFGKESPVGKTITVSNQFGKTVYTVNAVFDDKKDESDIKASVLLSLQTLDNKANRDDNDWADPATLESGYTTIYMLLKPGQDPGKISGQLSSLYRSIGEEKKKDQVVLQPFKYLHIAPSFHYPFQTFGSLTLVTVFSGIAFLILIIAWFNYINLSTTMALKSAGEVAVKKVLGASRWHIAAQFLLQTLIITALSLGLALFITQWGQPFLNDFLGKELSLAILKDWRFLFTGSALFLGVALLSGSYTAFVLSSFTPVKTLRGEADRIVKGLSVRKALVVFQFMVSILLIIGTIVLYRQLQYMKNAQLGMSLNQLLVITGPTVSSEGQAERNETFKQELAGLSFVKKIAASNNIPGLGYNFSTEGITGLNPQKEDEKKSYSMFICDQNFFDTYGISFVQGGPFSRNDADRSWNNVKKVILNEKAARQLHIDPKKPLPGQKILWGEPFEVIGVVKDYHHLSLREEIKPTVYLGSVSFGYFTIKTNASNLQSKLAQIKKIYSRLFPGNPFEYFFADELFRGQYVMEQKLSSLLIIAAALAIFIACLGLFGLASFSTEQRTKEIGIRKVLGASITDIAVLLSRDFIRLIILAILLAFPLAYWIGTRWLQNFAYRTSLHWWLFVAAAFIALLIAIATVSIQAVRAAQKNPVKNLRTD